MRIFNKLSLRLSLLLLVFVCGCHRDSHFKAIPETWIKTAGPGGNEVRDMLWIEPSQKLLAGSKVNAPAVGLSLFHPEGRTWTNPSSNLPAGHTFIQLFPFGSEIWGVYFSNSTSAGGIVVSRDNGASWPDRIELPDQTDPRCITTCGEANSVLLLGTVGSGILRSDDGGVTWTPSSSGLSNLFIQKLCADPFNPETILCGTLESLSLSTDSGLTWHTLNTSTLFKSGYCVDITSNNAIKATYYAIFRDGHGNAHLLKTSDTGATWTRIEKGLPHDCQPRCIITHPRNPETLFLGTVFDGIYTTRNNGEEWETMNRNFPVKGANIVIHSLLYKSGTPSMLFAGTDSAGAVWQYIFK